MKSIQRTLIIRVMLLFLFAVCVVPQSEAADLKTGLLAYKRGDWETALKEFGPLADQGELEAQSKLATMYREGKGVTQDFNMVVKWLTKAAEQGDATSQYNLGELYKSGEGVSRNYNEAVRWYTKSARQGNADAQYQLGRMYFNGKGVSQDFKEAVKWYTKSAKQGNADAIHDLAFMQKKGLGVDQKVADAVKLETKPVDHSVEEEKQNLPLTQKTDMATAQTFTEIDRLDSKQVEQIDLAVQQNHASINKISSGIITQNKVKVIAENKNTQMDDPVLLFSSGEKYFNGKGVQKNKQEAFKWYRKSAKLGYAKAEYRLGEMYHYGFGISEDHNEAVKWYTRSAMQGNKSAQHNLAIIYDRGEGVTLDSTKAYAWITIAASQGHSEAIIYEDKYYKLLDSSQKIAADKLARQLHIKIYGTAMPEDKYKRYKRQIIGGTESFLAESYKTITNWLFGDQLDEKNEDQEKKWSTAYGALIFFLLILILWGVFNIWGRNRDKTKHWR